MKEKKHMQKIATGKEGEKIAALFLEKQGYEITQLNYRCPIGEIDIVAKNGNDLVFVEVKTRKTGLLGYPEQAVGLAKQRKMSQLALWYLQEKKLHGISARFDVVAVRMFSDKTDIRLFKNAFDFIR